MSLLQLIASKQHLDMCLYCISRLCQIFFPQFRTSEIPFSSLRIRISVAGKANKLLWLGINLTRMTKMTKSLKLQKIYNIQRFNHWKEKRSKTSSSDI